MENLFKNKIRNGEKPIGTFFETASETVAECIGKTGMDFVIIDNEHSPVEAETTANIVRICELTGMTPIARVREISRPAILTLLDVGVQGLIIPCVNTVGDTIWACPFPKPLNISTNALW